MDPLQDKTRLYAILESIRREVYPPGDSYPINHGIDLIRAIDESGKVMPMFDAEMLERIQDPVPEHIRQLQDLSEKTLAEFGILFSRMEDAVSEWIGGTMIDEDDDDGDS
jgi:hypothetical protein